MLHLHLSVLQQSSQEQERALLGVTFLREGLENS